MPGNGLLAGPPRSPRSLRAERLEVLSARVLLAAIALLIPMSFLPEPVQANPAFVRLVLTPLALGLLIAWIHQLGVHLARALQGRYTFGRLLFLLFPPLVGMALTSLARVGWDD